MKWLLAATVLCACAHGPTAAGVDAAGRLDAVERLAVPAPSLAGSLLPNRPTQPALVFLPAGYHRLEREALAFFARTLCPASR